MAPSPPINYTHPKGTTKTTPLSALATIPVFLNGADDRPRVVCRDDRIRHGGPRRVLGASFPTGGAAVLLGGEGGGRRVCESTVAGVDGSRATHPATSSMAIDRRGGGRRSRLDSAVMTLENDRDANSPVSTTARGGRGRGRQGGHSTGDAGEGEPRNSPATRPMAINRGGVGRRSRVDDANSPPWSAARWGRGGGRGGSYSTGDAVDGDRWKSPATRSMAIHRGGVGRWSRVDDANSPAWSTAHGGRGGGRWGGYSKGAAVDGDRCTSHGTRSLVIDRRGGGARLPLESVQDERDVDSPACSTACGGRGGVRGGGHSTRWASAAVPRENYSPPNWGEKGNRDCSRKSNDSDKRDGLYQRKHRQEQNNENNLLKKEPPKIACRDMKDLTPEQKAYREKFKLQILYEGNISAIPTQAFFPRFSEEEKEDAARYALVNATKRQAMKRAKAANDYSSSDCEDYPGAAPRSTDAFALTRGHKKFFNKLKDCLPLTTGFDVEGTTNDKHCFCPCGKYVKKWRDEELDVANLIDERDSNKSPCMKPFQPMGLMAHLEKKGVACILHFGTRKYLEKLYESYNGPGIGHRYLYKKGDCQYLKADAIHTQRSYLRANGKFGMGDEISHAEDVHQPTIVSNNAPTIAGEKEKGMTKRIDIANLTPRSNFCDGQGEGLLLSNGVRPNPFSPHKLVNGGAAEKIVDVPNPGFADTILCRLGMMEKSDVVKECRQSTFGAEDDHEPTIKVHGHIGIDDGHVDERRQSTLAGSDDHPPTIVANNGTTIAGEKEKGMTKRIDITTPTPPPNLCDGEGVGLLLSNGVRPNPFPPHKLVNGVVVEKIVGVLNPGVGDIIPCNLGMMEMSDVVKECRQSTLAAEDDPQPSINVLGHIGIDDGHVKAHRQSSPGPEDDHPPTIVANNAPTIVGEKENGMTNRTDFANPTPRSNFCDGEGEGLLLSNGVRPNPFPSHKLVNGGVAENMVELPNPGFADTIPRNLRIMEKSDVVKEFCQSTIAAEDDHQPTINANNAPNIAGDNKNWMRKRIHFTNPTPRSNSCDGEGHGLLLSNGVRPNPLPQHKLVNGGVADNILQVPNPGFGDSIPRKLDTTEKSDVVEEVQHISLVPASGANVQSQFGIDECNADEDDEPLIGAAQEKVLCKSIDLTNQTPLSNCCEGEGEGLLLSNGVRPNPFPAHKLVNGGVEENILEVPNPGSGDTIPGKFVMEEKTDALEEVHHDTSVPALGPNIPSSFGMDDGNAEVDDEPIIAATNENAMSNSIDLPTPTLPSKCCDGEGEGLLLSNGVRPDPFPEHKLVNGGVDENLSEVPNPGSGDTISQEESDEPTNPGFEITIPANIVNENRKMKRELGECENQMKRMKRNYDVLRRSMNTASLVSHDKSCIESKTVVLSALDVVVEVGCQSYGFVSHSGNLVLNNEIINMSGDYASIYRHVKSEWIHLFILRFKERGSRFLVRDGESSFRLATVAETVTTVHRRFRRKRSGTIRVIPRFDPNKILPPFSPNNTQRGSIPCKNKHVEKVNVKTKRIHSSNSIPSSYFCDGQVEGVFLSNGERPNLFPEHKLFNGVVETNSSEETSGAAYIPKANSNSSNRIKAASVAFHGNDFRNNKYFKKRVLKKSKKQMKHLFSVCSSVKSRPEEFLDSNTVFVDGGSQSNPPINPMISTHAKSNKKKIVILSLRNLQLDIVNHHIMDVSKGLISRPTEGCSTANFLLPPRKDVLTTTASLSNPLNNEKFWLALCAIEEAQIRCGSRGAERQVIMDDGKKYFSVGTQTVRAGTGIRPIHYSLEGVSEEHSTRILKFFRAVEHLYEAWMDTKEIRIIHSAINLVQPARFKINKPNKESNSTPKTARIYGAIATGMNVYLNSHKDKDFTFSAVMLCMKRKYEVEDNVVGYFCFPSLGIVVPLRPGDVVFFNPRIHHCVSSRCNNADDIYALSLYLKSDNIGKNNNSIELLPMEKFFLGKASV